MSTLDLTLDPEPVRVRRMEVITGDVGRRTWSPEEKVRLLAEAAVPGAVVSEVARRHGLRPQQVFGWRREARTASRSQEGMVFAPVVLDTTPSSATPMPKEPRPSKCRSAMRWCACRPAWTAAPSGRCCAR